MIKIISITWCFKENILSWCQTKTYFNHPYASQSFYLKYEYKQNVI